MLAQGINKSTQAGIALITALLILSALSLLLGSMMIRLVANLRVDHYYQDRQHIRYMAEAALLQAEHLLANGMKNTCLLPAQHVNFYADKPAWWWDERVSCSVLHEEVLAYYIVEALGTLSCVLLQHKGKPPFIGTASYYRVTVRTRLAHVFGAQILQSTVVLEGKDTVSCPDVSDLTISLGRQSWREVV